MSETLYMRISTQNIVCSQRQMNTCQTYYEQAYTERDRDRETNRKTDRQTETETERLMF